MTGKPKIMHAFEGSISEKPPPQELRFVYLPGKECNSEKKYAGYWSTDEIVFYISNDCLINILNDAAFYGRKQLEGLGLIIGKVYKWKGRNYSVASSIITSKLDTSQTHVRFDRNSLGELCENLNLSDNQIAVGWYHSHPGHGCFMSNTDVSTQKRLFNSEFHCALVVDPFTNTIKVFGIQDDICIERGFAVYAHIEK